MLTAETRIRRSPELVAAPLGRELAMMDPDAGTYFLLDDVASAVWELLDDVTDARSVCASLQERFEVSPERCEQDVLPFLQHLVDRRLVHVLA